MHCTICRPTCTSGDFAISEESLSSRNSLLNQFVNNQLLFVTRIVQYDRPTGKR